MSDKDVFECLKKAHADEVAASAQRAESRDKRLFQLFCTLIAVVCLLVILYGHAKYVPFAAIGMVGTALIAVITHRGAYVSRRRDG